MYDGSINVSIMYASGKDTGKNYELVCNTMSGVFVFCDNQNSLDM